MKKVRIYYIFQPGSSSEGLLRLTASHYSGKNCDDLKIIRERGKKPYLENCAIRFSISHSADLWVCAFSDCEVGCDVQERRECTKYRGLAERWFSPNEASHTYTERDFFDIWSRKEAYVKLLGTGIDGNFKKHDTFTLSDAVIHDFAVPGAVDGFSASAACMHDFEIELFDINKI